MGAPIVLNDIYKRENHTQWAVLLIQKYEFKNLCFKTSFKGAEKLMRKKTFTALFVCWPVKKVNECSGGAIFWSW